MNLNPLENFYLQQSEPLRSCYLALSDIILSQDKDITPEWKYGCPFFYYKGKMFCYLWFHKIHQQPYLAIMKGDRLQEPYLLLENRSHIKVMLLDPNKDLPIEKLNYVLKKTLSFYQDAQIESSNER